MKATQPHVDWVRNGGEHLKWSTELNHRQKQPSPTQKPNLRKIQKLYCK